MNLLAFLTSSTLNLIAYRSFSIIFIWSVVSTTDVDHFVLGGVVALVWWFNLFALPLAADWLLRYSNKAVLMVAAIASIIAITTFWLTYTHLESSWVLLSLCASVLAATNVMATSSIKRYIPAISDQSTFHRAVGIASTVSTFQVIIGALFGGSAIVLFGLDTAIKIVVILYGVAFFFLLFISLSTPHAASVSDAFPRRIAAGFKVLHIIDSERVLCYTAMVTNFVIAPYLLVVVPYHVAVQLHEAPTLLALFDASFAFGMILGAAVLLQVDFNVHQRVLPVVVGNMLVGIGIMSFSLFDLTGLQTLSLCVSGVGLTMRGVACNGLRAFAAPNSHRVRLEGTVFFLCMLAIPFGSQLFGYLIGTLDGTSLRIACLLLGAVVVVVSFWPMLSKPTLFMLRQTNNQLDQLYQKRYPTAFGD